MEAGREEAMIGGKSVRDIYIVQLGVSMKEANSVNT